MALNNQPYLPLYVDDWMNNNKLKLCSPAAHGLMLSVMCVMHKEEHYGQILLKQKFKQTDKQIKNFACFLSRLTPFDLLEIEQPLSELLEEGILEIEGDYLICRRMVKDSELSTKRSKSGSSGGKTTQKKTNAKAKKEENDNDFAKAKSEANAVNVIVNEDVNENEFGSDVRGGAGGDAESAIDQVVQRYHDHCPEPMPRVQVLTAVRKSSIGARLREHGLEKVTEVLRLAGKQSFLNGKNDKGWKASLDWLMNPNNFVKVLEGNYRNKSDASRGFTDHAPPRDPQAFRYTDAEAMRVMSDQASEAQIMSERGQRSYEEQLAYEKQKKQTK